MKGNTTFLHFITNLNANQKIMNKSEDEATAGRWWQPPQVINTIHQVGDDLKMTGQI